MPGCRAPLLRRRRSPSAIRGRAGAAVATVLGALVIAGCGSSAVSSNHAPIASTTQGAATPSSTDSNTAETAHAAGPSRLGVKPCSSSQLKLSYTATQGATGHLEATFALRNVSGRSCSLRGYPAATLLSPAGHALATHLKRGNGFFPDTLLAPRRVVLAPGARAQFGLGFAINNEYAGDHSCPVAAWLTSVPPHASTGLRVPLVGSGHPRFAPCGGQLVASPVYAG